MPEIFTSTESRKAYTCFVLVPQCPKNDVWVNFPNFPNSLVATSTPTVAMSMTIGLIEQLTETLNIDKQRIYVTGYSMGGEGVFDILSRRPELFAAAVPICAVADTANARWIKDNNIWMFHGADDKVNDVTYSRMMYEDI